MRALGRARCLDPSEVAGGREGSRPAGERRGGTGLGLLAAYAGARVIERQLFGVPMADLTTFVSVPLVLLVVAAVACWVPARRAARVDPAIALSAE